MGDDDRMALMLMVKEGKINTETALEVVSLHTLSNARSIFCQRSSAALALALNIKQYVSLLDNIMNFQGITHLYIIIIGETILPTVLHSGRSREITVIYILLLMRML